MPDPITLFVGLQSLVGTAGALFVANNFALIALSIGSVALGNYQRRKALRRAKDAYNASLQDRLVMTATTDGPRSRVYGRVRTVDGVLFKATRGSNSEFYTLVIAVAGHEVDAIESIYFNDELLTLDGNGWVQTAPWMQTKRVNGWANITISGGNGSVVLPYTPVTNSVKVTMPNTAENWAMAFEVPSSVVGTTVSVTGYGTDGTATVGYQYDIADKSYARVRSYLGAAAQDLSADLVADFPTLCQSTDKFRGIALLRVDLEYSQDAFPTGVPNVTAVVRGEKVYDTRDGVTRWTQNPALIARDWARYAYGGNTTSVSDTAITTAANVCDADSSFALPSGTVVMDTYQAGIVCKLDLSPQDALSEMVEAMAGRWGWAGGTLKLVAGAYRAPVDTITEDWISDATDIVVTPAPSRSELVNVYRPTISNRDNKYQIEPAPPLIASTYVSDDGQELPAEIGMSAVTSIAHAQHISGVLLRDARQSLVVQLPCNLRAWKLELFDTVNVTLSRFGWTAKLFEVMGWRFSLQGGVLLTLKEASATVYNVDAGFADLGYDDNTELPDPWTVEVVQGLTVTSGTTALTDGSIVARTKVAWTAATDANVLQGGRIEIQWIEGFGFSDAEWPGTLEAGNATSTTITGLRANMVYLFRARYINGAGVRSRWCLHVAHKIVGLSSGTVGSGNICLNSDFALSPGNVPTYFGQYNNLGISTTFSMVTGPITGTYAWRHRNNAEVPAGGHPRVWGFMFGTNATTFGGFQANTDYVFSFYARMTANPNGSSFFAAWNNGPPTQIWLASPVVTTAWQRYAVLINFGSSTVDENGPFFSLTNGVSSGQDMDIACVQVERGSVLSGWAPSVADAFIDAATAQATADGKIDSFWQTTAPGTAAEGDLWFDTDDGYKQYRWTSGSWVVAADTRIGTAIANAATAQSTADGKIVTFVQASTPSATAVGDLWFDSDDGYKLYRAGAPGTGSWTAYQYGTSALALESATQVFLDEAQSNVYVSESTGGALDNRQLFNRQWTNTTGRTVTAEITGSAKVSWSRNASANGSYACSGDTQLLVYKNTVLQLGIAQIAAPTPLLTSGAPTSTQYANGAYTLALSPGDALEVRFYTACNHGNGGGSNDDCTITSTGTLRVTVVKA